MSFHSGFVTLTGIPNTGKSSLLNRLAGEKVAIVTPRPQTTRHAIRAVVTTPDYQVVYIDTPGLHRPGHLLGRQMIRAAGQALRGVDLIVYVIQPDQDPSGGTEPEWLERIRLSRLPVILAVNKTDLYGHGKVAAAVSRYTPLLNPVAAIPVSALTGDGLKELERVITDSLPEGPAYYPEDTLTDQAEKIIAGEMIREKALLLLRDEVPHGIGVRISLFRQRSGRRLLDIEGDILCEKENHKPIIIGKNGEMVKKIGPQARIDMEKIFGMPVNLQLRVIVRPDWRNRPAILNDLGYGQGTG